MPMLTVRLTDEEMARLKEHAEGSTVAALIRRWIASGTSKAYLPPTDMEVVRRDLELPKDDEGRYLPDQPPLPGGTTAIVDGQYARQPKNPDDQMALPGAPKMFKLAKAGMAKMLIEDTRAAFKAATEHLSDDEVDTAAKAMTAEHPWAVAHEGIKGIVASEPAKPSYLAAPDEDCVCGHDRHSFHLAGPCTGFVGKVRCDCTGFLADLGFG